MIVPACSSVTLNAPRIMDQPAQHQLEIESPADKFLNGAKSGLNRWWVWVLGTFLIVVIWMGIGSIPLVATCEFVRSANLVDFTCEDSTIEGASSLPNLVLGTYAFVIAMIGIWIVVGFLHKRPLSTVLTSRASFDFNRAIFAMLLGLIVFAIPLLLLAALGSDEVVFQSPDAWEFTTLFMFAVVLITIQASFEEVFFRGYLLQGFALLTRNKAVLALVTSIVFTLPHLPNPEPWEYGLVPYVARIMSLGFFFALLTLLDGGIELAAGIHIINNLVYTLLATTSVSVLQTPALFLIDVQEFRLFPDIIFLWLMLAVVLVILNRRYKWFSYSQLTSFLIRRSD